MPDDGDGDASHRGDPETVSYVSAINATYVVVVRSVRVFQSRQIDTTAYGRAFCFPQGCISGLYSNWRLVRYAGMRGDICDPYSDKSLRILMNEHTK